jgi:hypothetical protein
VWKRGSLGLHPTNLDSVPRTSLDAASLTLSSLFCKARDKLGALQGSTQLGHPSTSFISFLIDWRPKSKSRDSLKTNQKQVGLELPPWPSVHLLPCPSSLPDIPVPGCLLPSFCSARHGELIGHPRNDFPT